MAANDNPFKVGDSVSVIRERHGWHDGRLMGKVHSVYKNQQGIYSYNVLVSCELLGEFTVEVGHTRDLRKA